MGFSEFDGLRFKWDTNEKLTLTEQSEIDFKISQMGYTPAKKFLEEKYNITLEEKQEQTTPAPGAQKPQPLKVAAALAELYAGAVE